MMTVSGKMRVSLLFVLLISSPLLAQDEGVFSKRAVSRDSLLKISRMIIDSARCRVLVTVDENGKPHAREMDPFAPEQDMVIWFGTSPLTRKVTQIEKNPNVAVFYYDSKTLSYVSIEGKAQMVNDSDQKSKHWKDSWKRYYPDREKDFILIKVVPDRLELLSYKYNLLWATESYRPHSLEFNTGDLKTR
jgi:general stress protein 26